MVQQPVRGQYGQAQGLFDHGRLVAVHTSVQVGTGIGPSAAARQSVDHPVARNDLAVLGEALGWHGGLTLDYVHVDGDMQYIECNPRTVEPDNAAAAGVNIAQLQVRLTLNEALPSRPVMGGAGVRTHGTLALLLGAAAYQGTRTAVIAELVRAAIRRGPYHASREQLTPLSDPPSLAALAFVIAQALASPAGAVAVAAKTVSRYSIGPETIATVTGRPL